MSSASLCREVDCDALDLPYAAGLFVLRRPDLRVPIDHRSVEEHVCSWHFSDVSGHAGDVGSLGQSRPDVECRHFGVCPVAEVDGSPNYS
jgi:hypothetical protein